MSPTPCTCTSENIHVWCGNENFPEVLRQGPGRRDSLPEKLTAYLQKHPTPRAAGPLSLAPPSGWEVGMFRRHAEGEQTKLKQTSVDWTISQTQLFPRSATTEQHSPFVIYGLIWQTMNLEQKQWKKEAESHYISTKGGTVTQIEVKACEANV